MEGVVRIRSGKYPALASPAPGLRAGIRSAGAPSHQEAGGAGQGQTDCGSANPASRDPDDAVPPAHLSVVYLFKESF